MSIKWFSVGQEAVGVIAIGQLATGVVAFGQVATGVIAVGQLARGVIVVGQLAYGVVAIGQLGIGVGVVGGMIGVGARRWFGWTLGLFQRPGSARTWWRLALYAAVLAGFAYGVALPLWAGLFDVGGAFNQRLR